MDPIPQDVRELLTQSIETFEHLEIALLFGRDAGVVRTSEAVAAELRLPEALVQDALGRFVNAGLLSGSAGPERLGYSCTSGSGARFTALAEAYERDRMAVIQILNANALDRVRTSALRAFSSAFLFGKKHDG